jgi:hypothetical protein
LPRLYSNYQNATPSLPEDHQRVQTEAMYLMERKDTHDKDEELTKLRETLARMEGKVTELEQKPTNFGFLLSK